MDIFKYYSGNPHKHFADTHRGYHKPNRMHNAKWNHFEKDRDLLKELAEATRKTCREYNKKKSKLKREIEEAIRETKKQLEANESK